MTAIGLIVIGVIVVSMIIMAVFLLNGKGAFLIAGYNTMSKTERAKYNEKALCRFTGWLLIALTFCMLLIPAGIFLEIPWLIYCGTMLILVLSIGAVIYSNTGNRFRLAEGDNHNLSLKFGSKHITDQSDKDSVARKAKMGFANFSSNACGWIAAYNALISINEGKHPANIIRYIENNNGLIADGNFGVNPAIYKDLFKYYGLKSSSTYTATNLDKTAQAGRTAILCYFNDANDITQGAHYININWNSKTGQYDAYNGPKKTFDSIDDFLKDEKLGFISLITIY